MFNVDVLFIQVAALSAAFERAPAPTAEETNGEQGGGSGGSGGGATPAALAALAGLERCAALVARGPPDGLAVDSVLLTLVKFTGLLAPPPHHANHISIGVALGQSSKARAALRRACGAAARHAGAVRAAWRHLLEALKSLYCGRLLPQALVQAEDYLAAGGVVSLLREARSPEAGLLSRTNAQRKSTHRHRDGLRGQVQPARPLRHGDQEMVRAMVVVGTPPDSESVQLNPELEDVTIFFLELLGQTLIQNRDRSLSLWDIAEEHYWAVVAWAGGRGARVLRRALTALLRTAARLMRAHACAPRLLRALRPLLRPAAAPAPALVVRVRVAVAVVVAACCVPTRLRVALMHLHNVRPVRGGEDERAEHPQHGAVAAAAGAAAGRRRRRLAPPAQGLRALRYVLRALALATALLCATAVGMCYIRQYSLHALVRATYYACCYVLRPWWLHPPVFATCAGTCYVLRPLVCYIHQYSLHALVRATYYIQCSVQPLGVLGRGQRAAAHQRRLGDRALALPAPGMDNGEERGRVRGQPGGRGGRATAWCCGRPARPRWRAAWRRWRWWCATWRT
ncbi:hypothetical protein ACJJTC_018318 [Scirpophaga incertulas]